MAVSTRGADRRADQDSHTLADGSLGGPYKQGTNTSGCTAGHPLVFVPSPVYADLSA
jgi:hypothetical protein